MTTTKKSAKALILNVMTFGWILNKQTGHVGRYNEILQFLLRIKTLFRTVESNLGEWSKNKVAFFFVLKYILLYKWFIFAGCS